MRVLFTFGVLGLAMRMLRRLFPSDGMVSVFMEGRNIRIVTNVPEEAFLTMLDITHRKASDGNDPHEAPGIGA